MDKLEAAHGRRAVLLMVLFLGSVSFSCCIAAEFKKAKAKEMKLDGSLCALRQSPALGLGITALVCLSIAQMVGTSMAAARICPKHRKSGGLTAPGTTNHMLAIAFLLSWVCFGLAAILLGAGSSMNARQRYGKGWLDGKCYVVKDGVYVGAGVLVLATTLSILALMHTTKIITKSLPLHHHLHTTATLRDNNNNNKTTSTTPA